MTDRLYYADAGLRSFGGVVRSCERDGDRTLVVLERTAFYPTSGGQPFDVGRLGDVPVVDVFERADGEVVHVTAERLTPGVEVRGEIDWVRRFDHMQQHTGQHVLSAAFERTSGAETVSFHMGADVSTIDLGREVSPSEIAAAEADANRVIWEDRPVLVRVVSEEEAARLPLRKASQRTGAIRLVEIVDFDLSACGGTHVPRTGGIGMVAVLGSERFKAGTRLTFACGGRALSSHRSLRQTVAAAARMLGVGGSDLGAHLERLQQTLRDRDKKIEELTADLVAHRAVEWRASAETVGPVRGVLRHEPSFDTATLKLLAQAVVAGESGLVAVVTGGGEPTPVVVARSSGVAFDAGSFLRGMTTALGGRGGGLPELAQGGVAATAEQVFAFARATIGS